MSQRQADKPVTDNPPMLQQILAELNSLKAEVDSLKRAMGMSVDGDKECSPDDEADNTKDGILAKVKKLSSPLTNPKRYKTISVETIKKVKNPEQKKLLQQAYDILKERRLLTATNRPHDGWKFDFQRKSIELLFRVDNRRSAVYNTRHRPLIPRVIDGKIVKEEATAGEQYSIPYGLEKIDYSYKTIFVTEGIYDSCFLENCLAYSNWILPNKMSKVLDIYREAGFQIIHILDNFRLKDKGGVKGLEWITEKREWLSKGDKVFSWDIYSEFKDFNDVAIAYELDEIDPQTIIDHSWNEEEAQRMGRDFISVPSHTTSDDYEEDDEENGIPDRWKENDETMSAIFNTDSITPQARQKVTVWSSNDVKLHSSEPDDVFEDFMAELEAEQQKSIAKAKERELMKKRYEDHLEQEKWELNRTMKSVFSSKACV